MQNGIISMNPSCQELSAVPAAGNVREIRGKARGDARTTKHSCGSCAFFAGAGAFRTGALLRSEGSRVRIYPPGRCLQVWVSIHGARSIMARLTITSSNDGIRVVVISTAVCARAHRNNPTYRSFTKRNINHKLETIKRGHARGSGIWSYTFLSAGAILFVRVPATIIISDWRGLARKTTPRRSWSYRAAAMCIISTAQHARPDPRL